MVGCHGMWGPPNHPLFQVAHTSIFISYLAPPGIYGVLFLHGTLVIGFTLLAVWAWVIMCAPDIFSWFASFSIINCIQLLLTLYRLRPIRFKEELEDVYKTVFEPLEVSRYVFQKLTSKEYSKILSLDQGDYYAQQEVTRADRLGLLISGTAMVKAHGHILHNVVEKQFLDSPEFESSGRGEDRFHVDIIAALPCRYLFWQRSALEYVFAKEPYLAHVMGTIIGRDITNKLYTLNEKVRIAKGNRVDIRLPSISTAIMNTKPDDLKSMSEHSQEVPDMAPGSPPPPMANCDEVTFTSENITFNSVDEGLEDEEEVFEDLEINELTKMYPNGAAKCQDSRV